MLMVAATRLFRKHGYDAVSLRQIADEADIAFGSLYTYFPSKEAIAAGATGFQRQYLKDWLAELAQGDTDPHDRLTALIDELPDWFADESRYCCPLSRYLLHSPNDVSEARQSTLRAVEGMLNLIADFVARELMRSGSFPDQECQVAAREFVALWQGTELLNDGLRNSLNGGMNGGINGGMRGGMRGGTNGGMRGDMRGGSCGGARGSLIDGRRDGYARHQVLQHWLLNHSYLMF